MRKTCIFILLLSVFVQGCANLDTVDRTTTLPSKKNEQDGVAIHLDAKQRLVISKAFGTVCAEPSPDALSAFAASLGGSFSNPDKDVGLSLSTAFQSTVGSIGLRTQSITLMRDALYRICEAYYGRALTGPAVMTLLAQSQNLTAAILAIEQITGPVVANQVVLQGEAINRSSASILQMQKHLEAARKEEEQKKKKLDEAKAKYEGVTNELKPKVEALEAKIAEINTDKESGKQQSEIAPLETERDNLKSELDSLRQKEAMARWNLRRPKNLTKKRRRSGSNWKPIRVRFLFSLQLLRKERGSSPNLCEIRPLCRK